MKIICIGRNYLDHAKELNNDIPSEPLFFLKPDTALCQSNVMYHPHFSKNIHYEAEVVVKICKVGKSIDEKFAHKYYDQISLGIDFTARDIQDHCKKNSLPWEKAKAFDNAAHVGTFISKSQFETLQNLNFQLLKNNICVQNGNTKDMIFSIDYMISYVSQFVTLKVGDLIYTGTPAGVGKIDIGDVLVGSIEGQELFSLTIA